MYSLDDQAISFQEARFSYETQTEDQKQMIRIIQQAIATQTNCLVESATGTGKTICLLMACLQAIKNPRSNVKKIFYLTHTHTQMECIIQQLNDARKCYDFEYSVFQSRQGLCSNPQVAAQGKGMNVEQFDELCSEARFNDKNGRNQYTCCSFKTQFLPKDEEAALEYMPEFKELTKRINRASMVSLKRTSLRKQYCLHALEKANARKSEIIIMNYKYLTDQSIYRRKKLNEQMKEAIVVFDEAHHIPEMARSEYCVNIHYALLQKAQNQISAMIYQKAVVMKSLPGQKSDLVVQMQKLDKVLSFLMDVLQNIKGLFFAIQSQYLARTEYSSQEDSKVMLMNIDTFSDELRTPRLLALHQFYEENRQYLDQLCKIARYQVAKMLKQQVKRTSSFASFLALAEAVARVSELENSGIAARNYIVCVEKKYNNEPKVRIECFSGKAFFDRLQKDGLKTMIFASSSLNKDEFRDIGLKFVRFMQKVSLTTNQNIQTFLLNKCPFTRSQYLISSRYPQHDEVLKFLKLTVPNIPYGVIVFFKSYSYMTEIRVQLDDYLGNKPIYTESCQKADFQLTVERYLKQSQTQNGAVMFAVCRGKLSQGYNFKDNLCRAVFLVGLPLIQFNGAKYKLKQEVLRNELLVKDWYQKDGREAANQALGRLIRHQKDFGQLYIMSDKIQVHHLPLWMRRSDIKQNLTYQEIKKRTSKFFSRRKILMKEIQQQVEKDELAAASKEAQDEEDEKSSSDDSQYEESGDEAEKKQQNQEQQQEEPPKPRKYKC